MYYNLSLRNVKRSFRDYLIYFFTLTLSVAIFYSFNSLGSQDMMIPFTSSNDEILKAINLFLGILSGFVSVILAFLIIYANNLLIKRRKREFGIYTTLGMSKSKISKILLMETIIIGIFCLVIGLIIGVFISQGLSAMTAKVFEISLSKYTFIFSSNALIKTILCFGIIFLFISIFNIRIMKKYKLIDLIYASKKNEELHLKNSKVSLAIFILSVVILGVAYSIILKEGLLGRTQEIYLSVALGIIGTVLFFVSLAGFLVNSLKKSENIYFKNLNFFVVRQLGNNIKTNFISMSIISLMLFVTVCILASGIGIGKGVNSDLDFKIPYDSVIHQNDPDTNMKELLKKNGIDINLYTKDSIDYNRYIIDKLPSEILGKKQYVTATEKIVDFTSRDTQAIKLSDYNELLEMKGEKPISLTNNQYAIYTNDKEMVDFYNKFLKTGKNVDIDNKEYLPVYKTVLYNNIDNSMINNTILTLIVPDSVCDNLKVYNKTLVMDINDKFTANVDKKIKDLFVKIQQDTGYEKNYFVYTKEDLRVEALSMSMLIGYIGIYIGIIFLITSGSVLAIQQLSETSDNQGRYSLLRKLGSDRKMINKALFVQIGTYFIMPLLLAIVHSIVGLKVSNKIVQLNGGDDMVGNIIFAAIFICVIYGLYFITTFMGAKNIINKKR